MKNTEKKQVKALLQVLPDLNAPSPLIEQRKLLTTKKLFSILKDGEWHDLTDLSDEIHVQKNKLAEFSLFLSKQGVVAYDDKAHRIRIEPEWQNLLPDKIEST